MFFVITLLAIASLYLYVAPGLQSRLINDRLAELSHDAREYQVTVDTNMKTGHLKPSVNLASLQSGARVTAIAVPHTGGGIPMTVLPTPATRALRRSCAIRSRSARPGAAN